MDNGAVMPEQGRVEHHVHDDFSHSTIEVAASRSIMDMG